MAKTVDQDQLKALQAEVKALKLENARLKSARATSAANDHRPFKTTFSFILILFSVLLVLVANIFLWTGNTVFNTDNYVKAVNPIIEQQSVRTAIAQVTTEKIFENIEVEAYVSEALPPRIAFLAPQLTQQLHNQVENSFKSALASERFQDTWQQVNRKQHERIVSFIKNYDGNGTINVNEIYTQLQSRLADTPLDFLAGRQLPERVGSITVIEAPRLPLYHNIATNLGLIRWLSLALAAVTLFIGMWLSRNRRRAYYLFAGGIVLAMILTLLTLRIIQASAAQSVQPQYADAMRVSVEILTNGLRLQSILISCFIILTVFIVWISGKSPRALQAKSWLRSGIASPLHERAFGTRGTKLTAFIRRYKRHLEWGAFIIATLILITVRLSIASMLWWLFSLIIIMAFIEFIGTENVQPRR